MAPDPAARARRRRPAAAACLLLGLALAACRGVPAPRPAAPTSGVPACAAPQPGDELARRGDEVVVCGRLFHTGTRVVLWTDPGGFDAYRPHRHLDPEHALPTDGREVPRYGTFRRGLPPDVAERVHAGGWTLGDLQAVVHQVVIHYDASGTSAQCFHVLQDVRGLSCHLLLDVDGTVYQTLDLKERAWHAAVANDASVGIEIANPGAYEDAVALERWYEADDAGVRLRLPEGVRRGALPAGLVARPARPGPVVGEVHGRRLHQQDLTEAQYRALGRLLATLCRVLPRVEPDAPRGPDGRVRTDALGEAALAAYAGLLGHLHVTTAKVDPGPAFDWERVLADVRARLGRATPVR